MKTIKLNRTADGWLATVEVNGKPDFELTSRFGTNIVPTGWTNKASGQDVLEAIKKLNPEAEVSVVTP